VCKVRQPVGFPLREPCVDREVLALNPAELAQALLESGDILLIRGSAVPSTSTPIR